MNQEPAIFKFSLINDAGAYIDDRGILGSLGFAEKYSGETSDDDSLVIALRQATTKGDLSRHQKVLLRSFLAAWLNGNRRHLGDVAAYSIQLPQSVRFLSQVGFLDRTAISIARTSIGIASCALYLDASWDLATTDWSVTSNAESALMAGKHVAAGIALIALPECVVVQIQKDFGIAGTPLKRSTFSNEPILSMLRLCSLRSTLSKLDLESVPMSQLKRQLDQRIFALFLANSRQIAGLSLSGKSEASAAVATHTAIALGLHHLPDQEDILAMCERNAEHLERESMKHEFATTINSVRANLCGDFDSINRQLNRQLASAATTEAIDLVAAPIEVSFQAMAFVADTIGKCAPDGHFKMMFHTIRDGFSTAQSATSATPDALATAIDNGISAEAWTRKKIKDLWPFK
jgi:hypothetical protein